MIPEVFLRPTPPPYMYTQIGTYNKERNIMSFTVSLREFISFNFVCMNACIYALLVFLVPLGPGEGMGLPCN